MPQIGQDVSEVVDLPQVIDTELDEILRRREAVNLEYRDGRPPEECSAPATADDDDDEAGSEQAVGSAHASKSDRQRAKSDLVGLAFSGGGIRSASFNLGIFQALHRAGFIRQTDYLSTVSGGGYIGAHLASLVLGNDVRMDRCNFPLAPKERGEQPDRVIDFIRGGRYLVRQPLVFARWYFTGVVLNNLVLLSGLVAFATLIALTWRSLDTQPIHGTLRSMTAGWSADWNRPFFVAGFALLVWMAVKAYENWRSLGRGESSVATICLLMFYASVAIALGVLLGNGDIGGLNWTWTESNSKSIWIPLVSVLGVMLLPLLRPWRLLHSGTRPASKAEGAIFKLTSYALLAGVPLALIAYLAHENISGFSGTRIELATSDIHDWRALSGIMLPVEPDETDALATPQGSPPESTTATSALLTEGLWNAFRNLLPNQDAEAVAALPAEPTHVSLLDSYLASSASSVSDKVKTDLRAVLAAPSAQSPAKPVTSGMITDEVFAGDDEAAKKFLADVVRYMNQKVIDSEAFAQSAAMGINDAFWSELQKKEESWRKEVNEEEYRRDLPEDFADYQTLTPKRKAELTALARTLESGATLDKSKIKQFNRLYVEAAYPEFITNRNRILRSVVAVPDQAWRLRLFLISGAIFVVGLILVDPNVTSIHRYYSRQLARAYIEPVDGMGREIPMCRLDTVSKGAPYLLVNATVNLYGRRDQKTEPRDTFVFSRKFCGSPSTRFCPSSQYLGGSFDLANAMAISGGAVTTSSVGNPLVAVMMFVLNFRLGQWLPNPREQSAFSRPALWQVVVDLFRPTQKHSFCFISDGGHFENLGATALLDRKCKIVVISDAGQDGHHVFADFVKLYRELRTRHGIQFFELQTGRPVCLDALILRDSEDLTHHRGQLTERHFVSMGIRYQDGSVGLLVYIKPSFTGDEEVDLESFRASNPEFPHQPTSDQVYDEVQFESYRQLGYHIGSALCRDTMRLWEANTEDRIGVIARLLADTDWDQIERAGLGVINEEADDEESAKATSSRSDVELLLDQFRNGEAHLRILALKELVSLKDGAEAVLPELIAELRRAIRSGSMKESADRAQLAWAIGTFGSQARAAVKPLATWLSDPQPEVRAAAAEALGEIRSRTQTARKALEKAANDDEESVRDAAQRALQILGWKESIG